MNKRLLFLNMIILCQGVIADPTIKTAKVSSKKKALVIIPKNADQKYLKLLAQDNVELNAQLARLIQSTQNYVTTQYKRLNTGRLLMHGNLESQTRQSQLMQLYGELNAALHVLSTKNATLLETVSAKLTHAQYLAESKKSFKIAKEITDQVEHVSSQI